MSIKEGLTMNTVKMLVVFFLGAVVGAIALFFFLVFSNEYDQEEIAPKPTVTAVSLSKETCLDGVVQRARNVYMDLAERRESIALAMEHGPVSAKKIKIEDHYAQEKHLDISATLDYCLTYGELPAKSNHHILADMN